MESQTTQPQDIGPLFNLQFSTLYMCKLWSYYQCHPKKGQQTLYNVLHFEPKNKCAQILHTFYLFNMLAGEKPLNKQITTIKQQSEKN